MNYSNSGENTVSVLYCYNIYNYDESPELITAQNLEVHKPKILIQENDPVQQTDERGKFPKH